MIQERLFKDCPALTLENDVLRAIILPSLGGKVASLYQKNKEFELLFQNKEDSYRKPSIYAPFAEFDAAGFDDAFPSIDEGQIKYGDKEICYPDHGEIWSAVFDCKLDREKVHLDYYSVLLDYHYKKTFHLAGNRLVATYQIINSGHTTFPHIWALHCLIRCEEDMELFFPRGTQEVVNVLDSKFLGKPGKTHPYPLTHSINGEIVHLNKVLPRSAKNLEKYYVKGPVQEGQCGAYYPTKNVNFTLYFDKEKLPYLGFWVTEGGFRGDYNCALEPANGYYDSITTAKREGALSFLKPGEELNFTVQLEVL